MKLSCDREKGKWSWKGKCIIAVRNAFYGTFDSDPLSFMLASFRDIILNKNRRGVTKSKS